MPGGVFEQKESAARGCHGALPIVGEDKRSVQQIEQFPPGASCGCMA
jgi:hypothetical protein